VSVAIRGGRISEIALIASIYGALQVASALSVTAQLRQARLRRELAVAHAELRTASALLDDSSRADERLRIARELHDVLGHQLTALSLELEVASHQVPGPAREHVVRARTIARDLLGDVRATVGEVRSRTPVLGESLDRLVAQLPEPVVHLTVDPDIRVDEARAVAVMRCVQEMITNTIRHANADEMWIEVTADPAGALSVSVRDDGRASADFEPGHGLQGIRERIEGLGGTVTFSVDRGFAVQATVPAP
ncbi:MAG: histidine kinase, partial [Rhodococcus sp. (in: high G+C Gram-positive bacteria)]